MLFEEFFKKKKISLDALQQGDPGLFLEFKSHYEQMGEKSFDHTKKFWFNKLRHQYPLPPEVKAEKLRAENQIAEQTVADTLTEPSPRTQAPKLGFTPKFKTQGTPPTPPVTETTPKTEPAPADEPPKDITAKPATYKPKFQAKNIPAKPVDSAEVGQPEEQTDASPSAPITEQSEAPAKMGFKPRFKAGVTTSKPVEAKEELPEINKETENRVDDKQPNDAESAPPAKLGFKPRFKAGTTTVKSAEKNSEQVTEEKALEKPEPNSEAEVVKAPEEPKLGFKPRFKAGTTIVKPTESTEQPEHSVSSQPNESTVSETESSTETTPVTPPKLGFKPRFKAGVTTTKSVETEPSTIPIEPEVAAQDEPANELVEKPEAPAESTPPKPAYKPRFNPNMVKRNPPKEE